MGFDEYQINSKLINLPCRQAERSRSLEVFDFMYISTPQTGTALDVTRPGIIFYIHFCVKKLPYEIL